ncbi:MAG: WecB/TagA/CpsF family glycosyltransferase [Planctomycetaceae bacterium]|nr:WecB/TagA/CpsF family glycosyltransferase [Planctomycetaceae bacterium]
MVLSHTDCHVDYSTPVVALPPVPAAAPADTDLALETVEVWGLHLASLDTEATLDLVDRMIRRGRPGFFITANLHYARLTAGSQYLRELNERAAFMTADGMPLVWQARRQRQPLPQRVAGSDLVHLMCKQAALRGHRVFFLGGDEGVAAEAARRLKEKNPLLPVAGVASPSFREMSSQDHEALVARIRSTRPDILFAALGQPKGEVWLDHHCAALGVPVCVQIGASLDFIAGHARRAPRWMQRSGLEWFHRMAGDPRRLAPRYFQDALFLLRKVAGGWIRRP